METACAGSEKAHRGPGSAAPLPPAGRLIHQWHENPVLLVSTFGAGKRIYVIALDPGPGAALRDYARKLSIFVPLAAAALVILAGFYLRSLLAPYERLLAAAGGAPPAGGDHGDEREFVITRFESTIDSLHQKERELEAMARRQKERATIRDAGARCRAPDDGGPAAPPGLVVELTRRAGHSELSDESHGMTYQRVLSEAPEFSALVGEVLEKRIVAGRREVSWRREKEEERALGVTATPAEGADGRFLGAVALFSDLTEIRRLEGRVALARHLADLGEVSAGAAHEFRNAAAAIDGYADLARAGTPRARPSTLGRSAGAQGWPRDERFLLARPKASRRAVSSMRRRGGGGGDRGLPCLTVSRAGRFPAVSGGRAPARAVANLLRNASRLPGERVRRRAWSLCGAAPRGPLAMPIGRRVDPAERDQIVLPSSPPRRRAPASPATWPTRSSTAGGGVRTGGCGAVFFAEASGF